MQFVFIARREDGSCRVGVSESPLREDTRTVLVVGPFTKGGVTFAEFLQRRARMSHCRAELAIRAVRHFRESGKELNVYADHGWLSGMLDKRKNMRPLSAVPEFDIEVTARSNRQ